MYNDFTPSDCIFEDVRITGLIDWEMAGYIGWRTAGTGSFIGRFGLLGENTTFMPGEQGGAL